MSSRFLIVDDSEAVRQSLRGVLQAEPNWEVCGEASDGLTAVEMFRALHPTIVILDFQLPGIDGLEAARRMSVVSPAVPIVMFTQHASPVLEEHAKEIGVRAVVSKTEAFPMVAIIKSLLGEGKSSQTGEESDVKDAGEPEML
jgi:DNA-binding NarL/FixJ family response regulator